jgi:phage terminase small subunit
MSNLTDDARIAELRDTMTTKQFKLCEAILDGKKSSEAGRIAGYKTAVTTSGALARANVSEYIALCRKKASSNAAMTRERANKRLAQIVDGAGRFTNSSASEATGAVRELAKINGWYEPDKQEIAGSLVDRIRKGVK